MSKKQKLNKDGLLDEETPTTQDETSEEAIQTDDEMTPLEKVQAEAAEYLEGWQRARAEFKNFRARTDREREQTYQRAASDVLKGFLPVIDDLERALNNTPDDIKDHTWIEGINLINGKLNTLLTNAGLKEINPVGEPFDPNWHEAIGMDDSTDAESGHITVVLQKGYAVGDHVLRPALVRVAN